MTNFVLILINVTVRFACTVLIRAYKRHSCKGKKINVEKMKETEMGSDFLNCKITKTFSYCIKWQIIGAGLN